MEMAVVTHRDRDDLYDEAFGNVHTFSGTPYSCTQDELDASGGVKRQEPISTLTVFEALRRNSPIEEHLYPGLRDLWFDHRNLGPFISARTAAREVHDHNNLSRGPSGAERQAIGRLDVAIDDAYAHKWGPDLIIKAFCDLDTVFFGGRLRGHVCVAWKPDHLMGQSKYGVTGYLGHGKCTINLNAAEILRYQSSSKAFEKMWSTMLHEMCHAYAQVRAREHEWRDDERLHGKNFGTKIHAVDRRAHYLFGLFVDINQFGSDVPFPRHDSI